LLKILNLHCRLPGSFFPFPLSIFLPLFRFFWPCGPPPPPPPNTHTHTYTHTHTHTHTHTTPNPPTQDGDRRPHSAKGHTDLSRGYHGYETQEGHARDVARRAARDSSHSLPCPRPNVLSINSCLVSDVSCLVSGVSCKTYRVYKSAFPRVQIME
jgi:hypothetical protein